MATFLFLFTSSVIDTFLHFSTCSTVCVVLRLQHPTFAGVSLFAGPGHASLAAGARTATLLQAPQQPSALDRRKAHAAHVVFAQRLDQSGLAKIQGEQV